MLFRNLKIRYLVMLLVILIIIVLLNIKVRRFNLYGTNKYSVEEIKNIILNGKFDDSTVVLLIKDKIFKHKEIPYIEKYEIKLNNLFELDIIAYEKPIVGYIRYMSTNFYFDKDGLICESTNDKKSYIPEFKGISFDSISLGKHIPVNDKKLLNFILNITGNILNLKLPVYLVNIEKLDDIKIYLGKIEVLIGNTSFLEVKLSTLKDIYAEIKDMEGT